MKKRKKQLTKAQIDAIKAKLSSAVEYIQKNSGYLSKLESWELYDFQAVVNNTGYSLVQTSSLADYYKAETFCNENNLSIINHNF